MRRRIKHEAGCERSPSEVVTCGACGRQWCDSCTPTPSARCPFESYHKQPKPPKVPRHEGPLYVQESYINRTKGLRFGDSDVYETAYTEPGELYRACQREYGRCTGKVYIDTPKGAAAVGWVFVGRQRYEDTGEPYVREVWVSLRSAPDTVTRRAHYATLDGAKVEEGRAGA